MFGEKADRRRLIPISSATEEYSDLKISSLTGSGFILAIAVCIIDSCRVNIQSSAIYLVGQASSLSWLPVQPIRRTGSFSHLTSRPGGTKLASGCKDRHQAEAFRWRRPVRFTIRLIELPASSLS